MTKTEAKAEADRRWFTGGTGPDDVVAWVSRCRNSPRFHVGAYRRGNGVGPGERIALGTSDVSWEEAFANARAASKEQG